MVTAAPTVPAASDKKDSRISPATQPGTFAIWYSRGVDPRKGAQ